MMRSALLVLGMTALVSSTLPDEKASGQGGPPAVVEVKAAMKKSRTAQKAGQNRRRRSPLKSDTAVEGQGGAVAPGKRQP